MAMTATERTSKRRARLRAEGRCLYCEHRAKKDRAMCARHLIENRDRMRALAQKEAQHG